MLKKEVKVTAECDNAKHPMNTRATAFQVAVSANNNKCIASLRASGWRIKGTKTICPDCSKENPNNIKLKNRNPKLNKKHIEVKNV